VGAPRVEDLRLEVPPEAAAWWASASGGLGSRSYVVLAPTARWRCKQWPAERFAALGERLLAGGRHVVLVGAPGEEAAVAAARPAAGRLVEGGAGLERPDELGRGPGPEDAGNQAPEVLDLAGRTTVGRMMAVLDGASAVVACDSAPLHMAVGCGVPSVALFGPTDPALVGPRGALSTILRRVGPGEDPIRYRRLRDDDRYMRRLDVDDVIAAVDARLGDTETAA